MTQAVAAASYNGDPVTAWAQDVAAGKIVAGPYVRAAAARHLKDLVEGPARGLKWDLVAAKHAIDFFPRVLRLNGGDFEGKPFKLHPSQVFRIGSLFGWKRRDKASRKWFRRFRRFYDEEGKGNGKSPMLGGIGLYMMVADGEPRAEIYAAASKKDQARILFDDAVAMRDQSPMLKRHISAQGENPVWQLTYRGKSGDKRVFKPISADTGKSGPRPHCALTDEVHEHPNRDVIDMLERGFKFRKQPLLCMATNSGTDKKSICWEEHQHAISVVTELIDDDSTFAFVCSLDDGDDWENDPSCWIKVNPLLGEVLTEEYLQGVVDQAKKMPGKRNGIARLHFCQWTQSVTAAIKRESWVACHDEVDPVALTEAGYANVKLADSALDAADAELAKQRALNLEAEARLEAGGGVMPFGTAHGLANETAAIARVTAAEERLAKARREQRRAANAVTGATSEVMTTTHKLKNEIEVIIPEIDSMGGAMRNAKVDVKDLAVAMDTPLTSAIGTVSGAWGDFVVDGFKNFKGFTENVVDSFKNMLSTMIATAAKNQILIGVGLGVSGGTSASAGGLSTGGSTGGGLGDLLGLGSLLGGGSGGFLGGAISGIGSGVGGILSGGGLGSSFANLGGLATGASSGAGAIGAALPALGVVGLVAAIVKGLSREYKGTALRGSLGADGFEGSSFDFYKGGFLRSNKEVHKAVPDEIQSLLDGTVQTTRSAIHDMADVLGLGASAIDGFVGDAFTIWTNGLDEAELQKVLSEKLEGVAVGMSDLVLVSDKYIRAGETTFDTLARLSTSLIGVNTGLGLLDHQLLNTSLYGADAASSLADLFGGTEGFGTAITTYFNAFLSEDEQRLALTRQVTAAMSDLNAVMPNTRDQYRAMIEAQDLSTDSGRALYATLIGLASTFDAVLPSVASFSTLIEGLVGASTNVLDAMVFEASSAARAAESAAGLWYNASKTLRDFITGLSNSSTSSLNLTQRHDINTDSMAQVFAAARGGDVDAARDFPGVAKDFLATAHASAGTLAQFQEMEAQARNQANFLAGLSELEGANEDIMRTLAETQISVLSDLKTYLSGADAIEADTIASFEGQLGSLQSAIEAAEMFSYDYLKERLNVTVDLLPTAHIPEYLKNLIGHAQDGITSTIDFVIRSELPASEKWLAVNSASEHIKTISFLVDQAQFSDEFQDLAIGAAGSFVQSIKFIAQNRMGGLTDLALGDAGQYVQSIKFVAGAIPQPARDIVLNELGTITREINFLLGDTIPDHLQSLALDSADRFKRVINVVAGSLPAAAVRDLAMSDPSQFSRALDIVAGKLPTSQIRTMAFSQADDFKRVLNIEAGTTPPVDIISMALASGSELRRNIRFVVSKDVDADTRRIALAGNSELSRVVTASLNTIKSDDDALRLALAGVGNYAVAVSASFASWISDDVQRVVLTQSGGYAAMVEASLTNLDGAAQRILLAQQGQYSVNIRGILATAMPDNVRTLLLDANTGGIRALTIGSAFASTVSDAERELLLETGTTAMREIMMGVTAPWLNWQQSRMLMQLDEGDGTIERVLRGRVYGADISSWDQAFLDQVSLGDGTVERVMRGRVYGTNISRWDQAFLDQVSAGDGTVQRFVRGRVYGTGISNWDQTFLDQLSSGTGSIDRIIAGSVDLTSLNARQTAVIDMMRGATSTRLTLAGGFTFAPDEAFQTWYGTTTADLLTAPMASLSGALEGLRQAISDEGLRRAAETLHSSRVSGLNQYASGLKTNASGQQFVTDQNITDMAGIAGINTADQDFDALRWKIESFDGGDNVDRMFRDNSGGLFYSYLRGVFENTNVPIKDGAYSSAYPDIGDMGAQAHYDQYGHDEILDGARQFKPRAFDWNALGINIPGFAMGGLHTGGLRMVGEFGPELEATGPSRIHSASQTKSLLAGGGAGMQDLLVELKEQGDVSRQLGLRADRHDKRLTDILEKWDRIGMPQEQSA